MFQIPFDAKKDAFFRSLNHLTSNTKKIFNDEKIPFSAQTQSRFHSKLVIPELSKTYPNLLKQMHVRSQLLHRKWGRGSFIMQRKMDRASFSISLLSYFTGNIVFEFVEHFVQVDPLFKLNDYIVWFPLNIINMLFADWYKIKFLEDTSLCSYIMDLGFHILFIKDTNLNCFYAMGASKFTPINLHKSLKKYFNPKVSNSALTVYSANKFKKLLGIQTWNELLNHKLREQILYKLSDQYLVKLQSEDKNIDVTNKTEKCSYTVHDLLTNQDLVISVGYAGMIKNCKLLTALEIVEDDRHQQLLKPIIQTINESDFREFVKNIKCGLFDGRNDHIATMKMQAINRVFCEDNRRLIGGSFYSLETIERLYIVWIWTKKDKILDIMDEYTINKYFYKYYHNRSLRDIRMRILQNKLWGDKLCAYCKAGCKTKLCCGCYVFRYCCKEHQKRDWMYHRAVCKESYRMNRNMQFYTMG
eukprot:209227_1